MFIRIFALLLLTSCLLLATVVYAQSPSPNPCTEPNPDPNSTPYKEYVTKYGPCPGGLNEIEGVVGNVLSVIVGLGFVATLVLVVFAGIKYLTSGGEPKAIQSAHFMLTWALLGIFFMAVAWIVLQLIAGFTGVNLTVFDIKTLCKYGTDSLYFCKP